jgi:predicted ribosomally synthesized peptide with nif11-like leader
MTQEERLDKIKEIFADQDFVAKLLEMETPEEVQAAVKEKGVELTLEEIEAARKETVNRLEKKDSDEVSDEQLEQVAGGFIGTALAVGAIATCLLGTALCTGAALGIGSKEVIRRRGW